MLPLFSTSSAWNQDASMAAVAETSDRQILTTYRVLRGDTRTLVPAGEDPPTTWPFMDISYDEYAMPVFLAGAGQQSVTICDYEGNQEWPGPRWENNQLGGPITIPTSAGAVRPSGPQNTDADGHVILFDQSTLTEYDLWQATTMRDGPCASHGGGLTGSTIFEVGAADYFDLTGHGTTDPGLSSARAHGTALLAGLLLPEDIAQGAIAHALAFAIPGPRNTAADPWDPVPSDYIYPATTTETDFYNTDPNALAAGQRIRLKQTLVDENGVFLDESQLAPITRMFLTALRTYGAYLIDNAGGFSFSAEDIHTANLALSQAEFNRLMGQPEETTLPVDKSQWQLLMEKLNLDLERIPIAYGPWVEGQDPATATITTANFEVTVPANQE
jgi:hypothetical protein